jgi:hypothetical protein
MTEPERIAFDIATEMLRGGPPDVITDIARRAASNEHDTKLLNWAFVAEVKRQLPARLAREQFSHEQATFRAANLTDIQLNGEPRLQAETPEDHARRRNFAASLDSRVGFLLLVNGEWVPAREAARRILAGAHYGTYWRAQPTAKWFKEIPELHR